METLKKLINKKTHNSKEIDLQAFFKKHLEKVSEMQTTDLFLILKNEQKFYNSINYIKNYAKKKIGKNSLSEILLTKLTKNLIDSILNMKWFFEYYSYNKQNVNNITRFAIASELNNNILNEINF